jgi:hypothetical protein
MRVIARFLFAILPLALPGGALAQRQSFTVDPGTSHIAFCLGATGHDVHGTFHVQSGSVDFDRTAATMSGSVEVAAGNAESGNTGRDQKMHKTMCWTLRTSLKSHLGPGATRERSPRQVTRRFKSPESSRSMVRRTT